MTYNKGDIVKLKDGREVNIFNLPTTFMSNGSYEATYQKNRIWVKPEEILYKIQKEWVDDLNNYFEIIFDETGINIVPKELTLIELESDREDIKRIKLNFVDGRKHKTVNLHIGDTNINDMENLTIRKVKKKKGKLEKVIEIIKGDDGKEGDE